MPGMMIELIPFSSNAQLSGCAMNEFYTQIVLYLLYRFAHGGAMDLKYISGFCKATLFNNLYENIKVFNHVGMHVITCFLGCLKLAL